MVVRENASDYNFETYFCLAVVFFPQFMICLLRPPAVLGSSFVEVITDWLNPNKWGLLAKLVIIFLAFKFFFLLVFFKLFMLMLTFKLLKCQTQRLFSCWPSNQWEAQWNFLHWSGSEELWIFKFIIFTTGLAASKAIMAWDFFFKFNESLENAFDWLKTNWQCMLVLKNIKNRS